MLLWFLSILNPNGDDMHVGFQFESFVSVNPNGGTVPGPFGFNPRRESNGTPAGLHHDYGQIHNLCV